MELLKYVFTLNFILFIPINTDEILNNCKSGEICTCTDTSSCFFVCENSECSTNTELRCGPNSDCIVSCQGIDSCQNIFINGTNANSLTITADNKDTLTKSSEILCPSNKPCDIQCNNKDSCVGLTIDGYDSSQLKLETKKEDCCKNIQVYCPNAMIPGPYIDGQQPCKIIGYATNSLNSLTIYAVESFYDVKLTCLASKNNCLGICSAVIKCLPNYRGECTLLTEYTCVEKNSECIDFKIDTNNPTIQPTLLTIIPTHSPSTKPTRAPIVGTRYPTTPSIYPTNEPSINPTLKPTTNPTPTRKPTGNTPSPTIITTSQPDIITTTSIQQTTSITTTDTITTSNPQTTSVQTTDSVTTTGAIALNTGNPTQNPSKYPTTTVTQQTTVGITTAKPIDTTSQQTTTIVTTKQPTQTTTAMATTAEITTEQPIDTTSQQTTTPMILTTIATTKQPTTKTPTTKTPTTKQPTQTTTSITTTEITTEQPTKKPTPQTTVATTKQPTFAQTTTSQQTTTSLRRRAIILESFQVCCAGNTQQICPRRLVSICPKRRRIMYFQEYNKNKVYTIKDCCLNKNDYNLDEMYDAPKLLTYCNSINIKNQLKNVCNKNFEINIIDIQYQYINGRKILRRQLISPQTCLDESNEDTTTFLGMTMSKNIFYLAISGVVVFVCGLIMFFVCIIICCVRKNKKTIAEMNKLKQITSVSSHHNQSSSRLSGISAGNSTPITHTHGISQIINRDGTGALSTMDVNGLPALPKNTGSNQKNNEGQYYMPNQPNNIMAPIPNPDMNNTTNGHHKYENTTSEFDEIEMNQTTTGGYQEDNGGAITQEGGDALVTKDLYDDDGMDDEAEEMYKQTRRKGDI